MIYTQKKNKNQISIEITESDIIYKIKDETVSRREKVPYEGILNDQYELYESNKSYKNNAIYTAVVGTLSLAINIFSGAQLWAWLFLLAAPIFFYLYYRSKAAFTVIKTAGENNLVLLQDKSHDEIVKNIYKRRNSYLRDNYLGIDYDNDPQNEINKFHWLKELDIITEREYLVIKEEIEDNL